MALKPYTRRSKQLLATAYHEAGHAVACVVEEIPFESASIIPNEEEGTLGRVIRTRLDTLTSETDTKSETAMLAHMAGLVLVALAGVEAERLIRGRRNHVGASGDYAHAMERAMEVAGTVEETQAFLQWLGMRTHRVVAHWRPAIEGVAEALLTRRIMNAAGVKAEIQAAILREAGREARNVDGEPKVAWER